MQVLPKISCIPSLFASTFQGSCSHPDFQHLMYSFVIVGSTKFINSTTVPLLDPLNVWGSVEVASSKGITSHSKSFAFGQSIPGSQLTCVAIWRSAVASLDVGDWIDTSPLASEICKLVGELALPSPCVEDCLLHS